MLHHHSPLLCTSILRFSRPLTYVNPRPVLICEYSSAAAPTITTLLPPRWLSDLKTRIGKCILFGLQPTQIDEAGSLLGTVAKDWRQLVAGSEGFLVGRGRAGLEGQEVVWGEMVSRRRWNRYGNGSISATVPGANASC